jgi:hypothetical protein
MERSKIMSKTIAALAAAALLLLAHAAPASAISLANPAMMVGQGGISHEVSYRHGVVVVRGVDYYNGFRGVAFARPGYRFYQGFRFPPAAFDAGVNIDRTLAHPVPPTGRLTAAHVNGCFAQYRSYRAYDNTFQPHGGPRKQCSSPYN